MHKNAAKRKQSQYTWLQECTKRRKINLYEEEEYEEQELQKRLKNNYSHKFYEGKCKIREHFHKNFPL
jgi:hypothetical protein